MTTAAVASGLQAIMLLCHSVWHVFSNNKCCRSESIQEVPAKHCHLCNGPHEDKSVKLHRYIYTVTNLYCTGTGKWSL